MNIGDERSVVDGVRSAVDTLGGLDSVVNAAGILRAVHTEQMGLDLWNQIIGVNLTGTFLVVRETLPALLQNPRSAIVNFSSTSASFAHPYMAALRGQQGWGSILHPCAGAGVREQRNCVRLCVAPGSIKSGITDATGGYIPQDADWGLFTRFDADHADHGGIQRCRHGCPRRRWPGVIAMLVSDDGAFITGTEIRIDGGTHA